jgi:uncharacterized membrane protein YbhN (UPF0104 family)
LSEVESVEREPIARRPVVRALLQIAVAGLVVAGIGMAFRKVSLRDVATALRAADVRLLLLCVPLLAMNFWFRSVRFAELLGMPPAPNRPVRMSQFYGSVVLNHAANNVLPFRAGDLLRTRDFATYGYSILAVALTQLVEKIVEGTTLVACVSPVLGVLLARRIGALLAAAALGLPIAVWLFRRLRATLTERRPGAPVLGMRTLVRATWWSVGADAMDVGLIYLCARSLGIDAELYRCLTVYAAVNVAIAIPSTPGHVGALEAGASLSLIAMGVPRPAALAFALLYRLVQWVPVTLAGAVIWLRRGRSTTRALD